MILSKFLLSAVGGLFCAVEGLCRVNQSNLIILKIDALKLKNLVWEQSTDGNMFPHLYSDLDLDFVVKEYTIDLKDDGKHDLPDEL